MSPHVVRSSSTWVGALHDQSPVEPADEFAVRREKHRDLKACISDSMDDDLRRFTREHGYVSTSDCIRELLRLALYGPDHVLDLHRARIESLARNLVNRPAESGK